MNDVNDNDICDELELGGCTDDTACNFIADAVLDDGHDYAAAYYDCDGECLSDADGTACAMSWKWRVTHRGMQLRRRRHRWGRQLCAAGRRCDDENDATINDTDGRL